MASTLTDDLYGKLVNEEDARGAPYYPCLSGQRSTPADACPSQV